MATRDLHFNIFANDRASAAFARAGAAAEALASKITRIDGRRATVRVDADTRQAEQKLARAEQKLADLQGRRASPTIDADIKLFQARIDKANSDLVDLSTKEATPAVRVAIAKAESDLLHFKEKIEALNREKASPRVEADIAQAEAEVERLRMELDYLKRNGTEVPITADTSKIEAKIQKVEAELADLQRYRSDIDIDADIVDAERKIEQLQEELRRLGTQQNRPEVQVKIDAAQARLRELEAQLAALGKRESSPVVNLQTALVRQQIAQVRADLEALDKVKVDPEIATRIAAAQAEIKTLRAQIAELGTMRVTPEIQVKIDRATARIALLRAQMQAITDRNVNITVRESINRGANSALGYLNDLRRAFQNNINSAAQLSRNLRQLTLPASLAGLLPTLASLGASFREMAGAISLLPAAAGFAAAAIGTLAIGFNGLTDAIGPRDTGTQIKKAELAMSRLGEAAQAVARVVIDLKDEWNDLKKTVQNELFADIAPMFRSLAQDYIPLLKHGLGQIATEFNTVAKGLNVFFRETETMDRTNALFDMFAQTVKAAGPGIIDMTKSFFTLSEVGASFLPGLAQGFSNLMERFEAFTTAAKNDGSMALWMANSISAIAEFGTLLGNIGGVFGAIFDAAQKSGASFVETLSMLTAELEDFLRSGEGQSALISLFQGIREAIDAALPGVRALLSGIGDALGELQPSFQAVGTAFTALSQALGPTIGMLAALANDIIVPLSYAFAGLMSTIGPIVPIVVTLAVGIKAFAALGALIVGMSGAFATLGTAAGLAALAMRVPNGVATGMANLGNVVARIGNSLPLIGAALIAGWAIWDASKSKAEEYATSVTRGAMTVQEAIAEEVKQLENRDFWFAQDKSYEAAGDANRLAEATKNVADALRDQLSTMNPLQRAQAEVNIAEGEYADILARLGPTHRDTILALDALKNSRGRLTDETREHTDATRTDTEVLLENADVVMSAANADSGLERAKIRLEEQQIRTTEALRNNTTSSIEGRTAILDLRDAVLGAAEAAGRKAEADANMRGEADAATQGTKAYAEELIKLAGTTSGPVRDALLVTIANLQSTKDGSNDAALAAAGLTTEVKAIPVTQTTTYSTPGLQQAITSVQALQGEIKKLGDHTFRINAQGQVTGQIIPGKGTIPAAGDGYGYAEGGILPGYTPGRDVHLAALSGGESVMRPEWTRAVGADYVYSGNAVARAGGVGAVRSWLQSGAPTGARGTNPQQLHEFAAGGVVGQTNYKWTGQTLTEWFVKAGSAIFQEMQASIMGAGTGGGGVDWMMSVLRSRFPGLQLISGVRPGAITATGNRSYHASGRAVDVPPRRDVFDWIKSTYGANTKELIFSPAGNGQVWNGKPHYYSEPTRGDHWDHVHWAFDKGGEAAGKGWMLKNAIKPERILSPDQTKAFERLVDGLNSRRGDYPNGRPLPLATPVGSGTSFAERVRDALQSRQRNNNPVVMPRIDLGPLLRELAGMRAELVGRPQQVINQTIDGSRNPVDTGRSSALAIRLGGKK